MTQKVNINDVGTDFEVQIQEDGVNVDTGPATNREIEFTDPNGTKTLVTASDVTDGSDGRIHYETLTASEINQVGTWSYIGIVTFSPVQKFYSITPIEFQAVK